MSDSTSPQANEHFTLTKVLEQFDDETIEAALAARASLRQDDQSVPGVRLWAPDSTPVGQDPPVRCSCGGKVEIRHRYTTEQNVTKINRVEIRFAKWNECPTNCQDDFNRGDSQRTGAKLRFKCGTDDCVITDENYRDIVGQASRGEAKCGLKFEFPTTQGGTVDATSEVIRAALRQGRAPVPSKVSAECDFSEIEINFTEVLQCGGSGGCNALSSLPVKFLFKDGRITDTGDGQTSNEEDAGGGMKQRTVKYQVSCTERAQNGQRHPCPNSRSQNCQRK